MLAPAVVIHPNNEVKHHTDDNADGEEKFDALHSETFYFPSPLETPSPPR